MTANLKSNDVSCVNCCTMNTVKQVGKLFSLSSSLPQRPKLSFTPQEILEDVDVISCNEEYRNKLYVCINEKPPRQDHKLTKIEEYLKKAQDLEEISVVLQELSERASLLREQLTDNVGDLKQEIDEYFESKTNSIKLQ